MGRDEQIEKCREHVKSLLRSKDYAGLKETSYPSGSLNFLKKLHQPPSKDSASQNVPSEKASPKSSLIVSSSPLQAPFKLNIIISGAGLGGLAAAIALRRRGHSITVLERASRLDEVGAGIQIPPNSSRLLLSFGLGPYLEDKAIELEAIRLRRWKDGEVIGLTKLVPEFHELFGAPFYVAHRADLQLAMYRLALDLGVDVRLGHGVMEYDAERPNVVLDDGEVIEGDLVVAADGIRSSARKVVLDGSDQPPQKVGNAAYRAMVDTEQMKSDPDISELVDNPGQNLWIGDQRHVMTYSIAGGKSFNMVLSHPEDSDPSTWKQETAVEDMKQHFRGWDPRLLKVMNMIKSTLKWPLLTGTPLTRWVSPSGNILIIGDAAHTMVPYMSEGAAMAVEDGAALAEILSLITSPSQLSAALEVFEKVRMLRTGQMQEASLANGKLWHFKDGPEQRARDQAMKRDIEGDVVSESPNQWSDEQTRWWCYGYDAEREVREAWEEYVSGRVKL